MTTCPASVTIDGTEWRCVLNVNHAAPGGCYFQVVPPPAPLTLVEWLEQEVPRANRSDWLNDGAARYNAGRQACLDAAARWNPPAREPVDVDALATVIATLGVSRPNSNGIARILLTYLGLVAK